MRKTLYVLARYIVSFLILIYGFAKLNGSQFNVLDSELDKPMGQVDAFWLTWYFFGYSHVYSTFLALTQVLGGVLLMFRKTTLLGACILLPVMTNIILIDIFYGVAVDALVVACVIFALLLFIVLQHRREILDLFWFKQNQVFPRSDQPALILAAKGIVCALLVLLPYGMTYWAANYNNRRPTPIDGTWEFVESSGNIEGVRIPSMIFFEHNFAYMAVFKFGPGQYDQHYFRVDKEAKEVAIWEHGGRVRGQELFEGTYELTAATLVLHGRFSGQDGESTLRWIKRR